MFRNPLMRACGALLLAFALSAPAYADVLSNLSVNVAPVYWLNTAGDANAAPPAGIAKPNLYWNNGKNPSTHDLRLDYALHYSFNRRTSFFYTHDVLDYELDRVYMPHGKATLALYSGDAGDRVDQFGFNYAIAPGLVGRAYFLDHERYMITSGLCLNQVSCGKGVANANSGDMHGYALGATYGFGPMTRVGPLFSASLDAQYIPRPDAPPVATDVPGSLNGLPSWTGSKVIYPYSITAAAPLLAKDPTLVGFLGYVRSAEYFRNNASQNLYNVVTFGFTKVFNRNLSLNVTNLNYKECACSDTIPLKGEVLRAAGLAMKINYKLPTQPIHKAHP